MMATVAAASVGLISPWGSPARDAISERVTPYLPSPGPRWLRRRGRPAGPGAGRLPGRYAVDDDNARAWATRWKAATALPQCGEGTGEGDSCPGRAFPAEHPGRPGGRPHRPGPQRTSQASRQAVPKTVDLRFSDRTCRRLELSRDPGPQTLPVDIADATEVRVSVADAFPARDGTARLAALSEVQFLRARTDSVTTRRGTVCYLSFSPTLAKGPFRACGAGALPSPTLTPSCGKSRTSDQTRTFMTASSLGHAPALALRAAAGPGRQQPR